MMTSQMIRVADSRKAQKSKYLENETHFIPLVKRFINYTLKAILMQKIVFQQR